MSLPFPAQFSSHHQTLVPAPPSHVWPFVRRLDLSRSWLTRALFALRGLPSLPTLDSLLALGFTIVDEHPPEHLAIGLIGRFWTPSGRLVRFQPAEFLSLQIPHHAKALWTFQLTPAAAGRHTQLLTETRVHCPDPATLRAFSRYWFFIRPFSALTRRECLRLIRRQAAQEHRHP